MLSEEISRLIKNIEKELLEFVKYVKTIEEEHNQFLAPNKQTSGELDQGQASRSNFPDEKDFSNSPGIYDAIEIAKVMIQRIYNLLDHFSHEITSKERDPSGSFSYLEKYFYNQYVCQVLAYLLKIMEENLSIFSGELIQAGERKPHPACAVSEKREGKEPSSLRFSFFKPAALFTEDGKIYHSARSATRKPEVKSLSNHCESNPDELSGKSPKKDGTCNHCKCAECVERENKRNLLQNKILLALHSLVTVVENLALQYKNFIEMGETKGQSSPVSSAANGITSAEPGKEAQYILKECITFCESCKTLLKNPKYKNVQVYKEYVKENPTWHQTREPLIHAKLYRMEVKPEHVDQNKRVDEKKEHLHIDENASPHVKHVTGVSSTKDKENLKRQEKQQYDNPAPEAEPTKDKTIPAFSKNKQILKLEPTTPVQESRAIKSSMCNCNKEEKRELQKKSKQEPKFPTEQQRMKAHFSTETEFPSNKRSSLTKGTNTRQLEKDSSSEEDEDKTDVKDIVYPETVTFDFKKFSKLLHEKFRKIKGKSESKMLQDIVITSLKESSDFKYETARKKADKMSEVEASVDKVDDFEALADKAVDDLVEDIISVATEVALSKLDPPEKFPSQNKESRDKEDEHIPGTLSVDSEEFLKLYTEQDEMNKKVRPVTQACISCANMGESCITTGLPKLTNLSTLKLHRKKSLTDTCFHCWNACQRGLTIHQCHFTIPPEVLEIRHMDDSARILVCFLQWDITKEPDDWRWQKYPFPDPTRIEIQQSATNEMDPIFKVVYGPEGTMVKESFGETRLRTIRDFIKFLPTTRMKDNDVGKIVKSDSMTTIRGEKIMRKLGLRYKKPDITNIKGYEFQLFNKLSRFYDDIQKFGYGRGPPLILKLRRNYVLHDAYDLLMVPSKVRLHYYRNLRVIFISENNSREISSKSNFAEEDESDELFEHFTRKLFSTEAFQLFDYPSEEAHYMYLNPDTHTPPQWFVFAGAVLALAFFHQKKMNIKLSSCLFKCLLDRPLVINDLQSIDPLLYQRLMWLKENDLSIRKTKMTFIIRDKVGGSTIETELMTNGRHIAVTEKNKYRYIELAVKWKLAERCLTQLKDFRRGFASVVDPCFLSLFKENELLSIIKNPPAFEVFLPECASGVKSVTRRGTW